MCRINMQRFFTVLAIVLKKLPRLHKLIVSLTLIFVVVLLISGENTEKLAPVSIAEIALEDEPAPGEQPELAALPDLPDYERQIKKGDTLGKIFAQMRLPQSTMYAVLEADLDVLVLDTLNPGHTLRFWVDENTGQLERLEVYLGIAHQVMFTRNDKSFEYREVIPEGEWRLERVAGSVTDNFYKSAQRAGLNAENRMQIRTLLKNKINFSKAFRKGDRFQIIRTSQYIDGEPSGNSKVEGVRIYNRSNIYTAFAFDGNYYDSQGEGLERAFSRTPLKKKYRMSSRFNPRRKHPVTGLIRPHNGTDFATPIGTPVYATGDGVVKRVVRHRYAGLYVEIAHGQKYRTRFLHLSKALVRKGQTVKRGQKIALTGNTGRSTGAHLHFEFHVNKKPINPLGKNVPVALGLEGGELKKYKRRVAELTKMMDDTEVTSVVEQSAADKG